MIGTALTTQPGPNSTEHEQRSARDAKQQQDNAASFISILDGATSPRAASAVESGLAAMIRRDNGGAASLSASGEAEAELRSAGNPASSSPASQTPVTADSASSGTDQSTAPPVSAPPERSPQTDRVETERAAPSSQQPSPADARSSTARSAVTRLEGSTQSEGQSTPETSTTRSLQPVPIVPATVRANAVSTAAPQPAPQGPSPVSGVQPAVAAQKKSDGAQLRQAPPKPQPKQDALPPEAEKVIGRVRRGLESAALDKGSIVTLRLTPKQLGDVHVRVEMVQDRVTADIAAGNDRARRLLRRHLDDLRDSLSARGLRVESVRISHDPQGWMPTQARETAEHQRWADGGQPGVDEDRSGGESPANQTRRDAHAEQGHEHEPRGAKDAPRTASQPHADGRHRIGTTGIDTVI